jgi:hypothetical protein
VAQALLPVHFRDIAALRPWLQHPVALESAVLAGAAVVVPQIEIDEIDGLREGRAGDHAVLAQRSDEFLRGAHVVVGGLDHLFGLGVDAIRNRWRVALRADVAPISSSGTATIPSCKKPSS